MLEQAIALAVKAHKGQIDKSGQPYILHVLRVGLSLESELEKICGILHDVIEDTDTTYDDLRKEGFSDEVIEVIELLTKHKNEPNVDYINRILKCEIACQVKLADLKDNMDERRLQNMDEKTVNRLMNKYQKGYDTIINHIASGVFTHDFNCEY